MSTKSSRTPLCWMRKIAAVPKNLLLDFFGSVGTRRWRPVIEKKGADTVRPDTLPGVLELYSSLSTSSTWNLVILARLFPHTFYIVEEGSTVMGFCSCNVRPSLSHAGLVLTARIQALGVLPAQRGQGVACRMLERCMAEMDRNGMASIDLFVDKANLPAISIYSCFGLKVVGDEVSDVCGRGKTCYRMERTFGPV